MSEMAQNLLPFAKIIVGGLFLIESSKYKQDAFKRWCLVGISAAIML